MVSLRVYVVQSKGKGSTHAKSSSTTTTTKSVKFIDYKVSFITVEFEKNVPRPGITQNSCEFSGFEPGTFRSSV